jgi:hypothetical protein
VLSQVVQGAPRRRVAGLPEREPERQLGAWGAERGYESPTIPGPLVFIWRCVAIGAVREQGEH